MDGVEKYQGDGSIGFNDCGRLGKTKAGLGPAFSLEQLGQRGTICQVRV